MIWPKKRTTHLFQSLQHDLSQRVCEVAFGVKIIVTECVYWSMSTEYVNMYVFNTYLLLYMWWWVEYKAKWLLRDYLGHMVREYVELMYSLSSSYSSIWVQLYLDGQVLCIVALCIVAVWHHREKWPWSFCRNCVFFIKRNIILSSELCLINDA